MSLETANIEICGGPHDGYRTTIVMVTNKLDEVLTLKESGLFYKYNNTNTLNDDGYLRYRYDGKQGRTTPQ